MIINYSVPFKNAVVFFVSFITGRKGGRNAIYNGHVYTFNRKKDSGVMYWQCNGKWPSSARIDYVPKRKHPSSGLLSIRCSHPSSATHIETLMVLPKIKNDSNMKDKLSGTCLLDSFINTLVIPYTYALYPFTNRKVVIPYAGERNHHRAISTLLVLFDSPQTPVGIPNAAPSECFPRISKIDGHTWTVVL